MGSVDYWEDSQIDSLVEYDASINTFVKDSICPDEEEEEHVVDEAGREKERTDVVEVECMIVDDTFDRDDQIVSVDAVEEEEVQSTVGNGEKALLVKGKDEAIMVNDDKEIVVIYDDDDVVVIYDDDIVVNDKDLMVAKDCDEEKGLCSITFPAEFDLDQPYGEDVILASNGKEDRDFDLNKLPLLGIFTFPDPSAEKRFIEIMRKYQSKYY